MSLPRVQGVSTVLVLSWHQPHMGRVNGGTGVLLGQRLQIERNPYKPKPDAGIDKWMSREENLSHQLCLCPDLFLSAETNVGSVCLHFLAGIIQQVGLDLIGQRLAVQDENGNGEPHPLSAF